MPFGDFLAISPAQVLASEAQKRQQDLAEQQAAEQARQFQQQIQARANELAQSRADAQARELASGAWEQKKWGVDQASKERAFSTEQGWKQKAADWQAGGNERAIALGKAQKEIEGKWLPKPNQPGILYNPVTGEEKLSPVLAETPGQIQQRAIDTNVGIQTGLAPGIEATEQRKAKQTAEIKQQEFDREEQRREIVRQRNGWVVTGLDAQGHTESGLPEQPVAPGLEITGQKIGNRTYGRPDTLKGTEDTPSLKFQKEKYEEEKILKQQASEEKKAMNRGSELTLALGGKGAFSKKISLKESQGLQVYVDEYNALARKLGKQEVEFWETGGWKRNSVILRPKQTVQAGQADSLGIR